jgi:hypothetical protein
MKNNSVEPALRKIISTIFARSELQPFKHRNYVTTSIPSQMNLRGGHLTHYNYVTK